MKSSAFDSRNSRHALVGWVRRSTLLPLSVLGLGHARSGHGQSGYGHTDPIALDPGPERSIAGFTLLELLVVMAMAGILAAIAAPTWSNMILGQRLGIAQEATLNALREAQAKSRQNRRDWAACFRSTGSGDSKTVEYAVFPLTTSSISCSNASWKPIIPDTNSGVQLAAETNVPNNIIAFDHRGWLKSNDMAGKRIVYSMINQPNDDYKSCIYIETLLGAMQGAQGKTELGKKKGCTP